MREIASSTSEQSSATQEIAQGVENIAEMADSNRQASQQNNEGAERSTLPRKIYLMRPVSGVDAASDVKPPTHRTKRQAVRRVAIRHALGVADRATPSSARRFITPASRHGWQCGARQHHQIVVEMQSALSASAYGRSRPGSESAMARAAAQNPVHAGAPTSPTAQRRLGFGIRTAARHESEKPAWRSLKVGGAPSQGRRFEKLGLHRIVANGNEQMSTDRSSRPFLQTPDTPIKIHRRADSHLPSRRTRHQYDSPRHG